MTSYAGTEKLTAAVADILAGSSEDEESMSTMATDTHLTDSPDGGESPDTEQTERASEDPASEDSDLLADLSSDSSDDEQPPVKTYAQALMAGCKRPLEGAPITSITKDPASQKRRKDSSGRAISGGAEGKALKVTPSMGDPNKTPLTETVGPPPELDAPAATTNNRSAGPDKLRWTPRAPSYKEEDYGARSPTEAKFFGLQAEDEAPW